MCVNAGGDPGRDDYGLPPVDIEVPDDARDLARDVLAYHRELRSQRRNRLARRFLGPLTRDGMVLPLLAGCLAMTLVAATLLTVFTARQPTVSLRPERPAAGTSQSPVPAYPAATLVNTTLFAAGQATPLDSLPGPVVVLALIPPRCRCLGDLRELLIQASKANTLIYLVGVHNTPVGALAADLGLGASHGLEDSTGSLPARYMVAALTAVLVRPDGTAIPLMIPDHHGFQIQDQVHQLVTGSTATLGPASPSAGAPTASDAPAGIGTPADSTAPAASPAPTG